MCIRDRLQAEVNQAESARLKVERGVDSYVSFFAENPSRFRVLYGEGVRSDSVFSEQLRSVDETFHEFTAEHIEIEELDRRRRLVAAQAIAGMLEHAVGHWLHSKKSLTSDELTSTLTALAWRGLRGTPQPN